MASFPHLHGHANNICPHASHQAIVAVCSVSAAWIETQKQQASNDPLESAEGQLVSAIRTAASRPSSGSSSSRSFPDDPSSGLPALVSITVSQEYVHDKSSPVEAPHSFPCSSEALHIGTSGSSPPMNSNAGPQGDPLRLCEVWLTAPCLVPVASSTLPSVTFMRDEASQGESDGMQPRW